MFAGESFEEVPQKSFPGTGSDEVQSGRVEFIKKRRKTMSYTKPQVVALGTSLEAIQGTKEDCVHQDSQILPSTAGAYLADE